jgi:hypothetical protein
MPERPNRRRTDKFLLDKRHALEAASFANDYALMFLRQEISTALAASNSWRFARAQGIRETTELVSASISE